MTLYEVTEGTPSVIESAVTDAAGRFSLRPSRLASECAIDQTGNVWAMNNRKLNFDVDADPTSPDEANPGGDGIVIFVGLAKPPVKKHGGDLCGQYSVTDGCRQLLVSG